VERAEDVLPNTLRGAVGLLVLQAAGLLVLVGLVGYVLSREDPAAPYSRAFLPFALLALAWAALLAVLGWQLARRRAWARSPALALELLFLPLGYYLIQGGAGVVGIPMIILALACAGLLIAPASRAALGIR
jgi:hypothetical protein